MDEICDYLGTSSLASSKAAKQRVLLQPTDEHSFVHFEVGQTDLNAFKNEAYSN